MSSSSSSSSSSIPTSSSTTPPSTVPPLPLRLPHCEANTLNFETGFEDTYCVEKLTNVFTCYICKGYPRRPVFIDNHTHLFCEACLMEHFKYGKDPKDGDPEAQFRVQMAACPICRVKFSFSEMCAFEHMDAFTKAVLKERQVRCPFGCSFVGNSFEVDEHQVYACPRRRLQCPNKDCEEILEAAEMEREHWPTCPKRRVHCMHCKLPVLACEEESHDCVSRLQSAIKSI